MIWYVLTFFAGTGIGSLGVALMVYLGLKDRERVDDTIMFSNRMHEHCQRTAKGALDYLEMKGYNDVPMTLIYDLRRCTL